MTQTDSSIERDAFAGVLQQALVLGAEDQRRLWDVLGRVIGHSANSVAPADAITAQDAGEAVTNWLAGLESMSAWERLELIEDAMGDAGSDAERSLLLAARKELLDAHPPLAVRRAVMELASAHPMAAGIGALGLLLAVIALARNLFRIAF